MKSLTLAPSREIRCKPQAAHMERKAIGNQQRKSVNTSKAIRFAMRESFEFQALTLNISILSIFKFSCM